MHCIHLCECSPYQTRASSPTIRVIPIITLHDSHRHPQASYCLSIVICQQNCPLIGWPMIRHSSREKQTNYLLIEGHRQLSITSQSPLTRTCAKTRMHREAFFFLHYYHYGIGYWNFCSSVFIDANFIIQVRHCVRCN